MIPPLAVVLDQEALLWVGSPDLPLWHKPETDLLKVPTGWRLHSGARVLFRDKATLQELMDHRSSS